MDRTSKALVGGGVAVVLVLAGVVVELSRRLAKVREDLQTAQDEFLVAEKQLSDCRAELRSAQALE